MNASSAVQPQKQEIIDYPVQIGVPNIERWRSGNTGTSYIHRFASRRPGPHVLIAALVHGNEPAGAIALDQILASGFVPQRGTLTLAFANADAYSRFETNNPRASRWIEEDMNRVWSDTILDAVPHRSPDAARAAELRPFIREADYLLDIHTTQHPSEPLVLAGPLPRSCSLARTMGLTDIVIIDRGHAQGQRMRDYGAFGDPSSEKTALLLECGQHWASGSAAVAYAACLRMLDRLDMLPNEFRSDATAILPSQATRFIEITHPITVQQEFVFALSLKGGEVIPDAGTIIGYDGSAAVRTPYDNCVVVMPSQRLWKGLTAVRLGRMISPPPSAVGGS